MEQIEFNTTNYLETGVVIPKDDGPDEVYQIPYNINNFLISKEEILKILSQYNVNFDKISESKDFTSTSLSYFHKALTHKSYVKKEIFTDEILKASKKEFCSLLAK